MKTSDKDLTFAIGETFEWYQKLNFMKLPLLSLFLSLCLFAQAQTFSWNNEAAVAPKGEAPEVDYSGIAKIYPDYYEGNPTALGETFHQALKTAAHKKLPLGTIVKVTRHDNGRSTTVRINDRGAYCDECVIDLSKAAAQELDLLSIGQARVSLTIVGASSTNPAAYGASTSLEQEPRFTSRGISAAAPQEYQATPPAPNAYQLREPALTVRTPDVAEQPQLVVNTTKPSPTSPSTPATGQTTSAGQVNIIDVPISPFAVQLGAYEKYANAERHVLKLQAQGFNNIFLLKEPATEGTPLHRVIVAPFLTLDDAREYAEDLEDYHQIKGLVFQTKLVEIDQD